MSAMNDALEADIRAHLFRTATSAKPTTITAELYTAAPGEAGGGTKVTGGSYADQTLNPLDANWTAASSTDGLTDNAVAITYPAPTATWGVVNAMALQFGGGRAIFGPLTTPKTVNNGDPAPSFPIGSIDVTFA